MLPTIFLNHRILCLNSPLLNVLSRDRDHVISFPFMHHYHIHEMACCHLHKDYYIRHADFMESRHLLGNHPRGTLFTFLIWHAMFVPYVNYALD